MYDMVGYISPDVCINMILHWKKKIQILPIWYGYISYGLAPIEICPILLVQHPT